jgi:hypothetical protein
MRDLLFVGSWLGKTEKEVGMKIFLIASFVIMALLALSLLMMRRQNKALEAVLKQARLKLRPLPDELVWVSISPKFDRKILLAKRQVLGHTLVIGWVEGDTPLFVEEVWVGGTEHVGDIVPLNPQN